MRRPAKRGPNDAPGPIPNTQYLIVVLLIVMSFMLAWRLPGDAVARSMFQSEPPTETPVPPTDTPEPTAELPATTVVPSPVAPETSTATVAPQPDLTPAPPGAPPPTAAGLEPPTPVPTPPMPPEPEVTPSPTGQASPAPGFLPPPTLSLPGSNPAGSPPSLLPGSQPPLAAPPAPPVERQPAPADSPAGDVLDVAQLIDAGVVALGYIWLCCGALALVGVTLILVWLLRGGRSR